MNNMQEWMDDYNAYIRYAKINCLCGHPKHCDEHCPKCEHCSQCECEQCITKGYN